MEEKCYSSVTHYLNAIEKHVKIEWTREKLLSLNSPDGEHFPDKPDIERILATRWFRGQPKNYSLLPKVYRHKYDETEMLLQMRRQAALMESVPDENEIVQWYFLLQHHGFPTRLIDWTESSLIALFFAVERWDRYSQSRRRMNPVVWMINPYALNWALRKSSIIPGTGKGEGIYNGDGKVHIGVGRNDIDAAWKGSKAGRLPRAIASTYIHVRMQVQSSRFTVHGHARIDLRKCFKEYALEKMGFCKAFHIDPSASKELLFKLQQIGISRSMLFPGLDSLSKQFDETYRIV